MCQQALALTYQLEYACSTLTGPQTSPRAGLPCACVSRTVVCTSEPILVCYSDIPDGKELHDCFHLPDCPCLFMSLFMHESGFMHTRRGSLCLAASSSPLIPAANVSSSPSENLSCISYQLFTLFDSWSSLNVCVCRCRSHRFGAPTSSNHTLAIQSFTFTGDETY